MNQLTKQSSDSEIKAYFEGIAKLMQSNESFPVNLEDVWQLVYSTKGKAVQTLKRSELFIEGIDYQIFNQKVKKSGVFNQEGKPRFHGSPNASLHAFRPLSGVFYRPQGSFGIRGLPQGISQGSRYGSISHHFLLPAYQFHRYPRAVGRA